MKIWSVDIDSTHLDQLVGSFDDLYQKFPRHWKSNDACNTSILVLVNPNALAMFNRVKEQSYPNARMHIAVLEGYCPLDQSIMLFELTVAYLNILISENDLVGRVVVKAAHESSDGSEEAVNAFVMFLAAWLSQETVRRRLPQCMMKICQKVDGELRRKFYVQEEFHGLPVM